MAGDRAAVTGLPRAMEAASPDPQPQDKRAWRAWADSLHRARSAQARQQHSRVLVTQVTQRVAQIGAHVVGLYSPIGAELETRELAHALLLQGVQLAYPRVRPTGEAMDFALTTAPAALQPRPRSRLLEPVGPALAPEQLDCVVVPAQAVRPDGKRLGRGGGYFDRYLPLLRANAVTIAVCPAACVVAWQPTEPHDQALDLVCTEHGLAALS